MALVILIKWSLSSQAIFLYTQLPVGVGYFPHGHRCTSLLPQPPVSPLCPYHSRETSLLRFTLFFFFKEISQGSQHPLWFLNCLQHCWLPLLLTVASPTFVTLTSLVTCLLWRVFIYHLMTYLSPSLFQHSSLPHPVQREHGESESFLVTWWVFP